MGRVLHVQDVVLDMPVALKVVRPDLAADRRFRKLFDLEVRIAARFTHPHIVPLHDLGELVDGTPFLGLALADAGSFAHLRESCPPWDELLRLMLELLEALSHLHARDVLHRDLKPENILLFHGEGGQRHVWLADLGLANASTALARKKGRVEGTPGYMAPEQKLGLPREYGPSTDLYSLGIILWEVVTGALPFAKDRTALNQRRPRFRPRKGLSVPPGLEQVLSSLLAPDPMGRYDLAADVRTVLGRLGLPTLSGEFIDDDDDEGATEGISFSDVAFLTHKQEYDEAITEPSLIADDEESVTARLSIDTDEAPHPGQSLPSEEISATEEIPATDEVAATEEIPVTDEISPTEELPTADEASPSEAHSPVAVGGASVADEITDAEADTAQIVDVSQSEEQPRSDASGSAADVVAVELEPDKVTISRAMIQPMAPVSLKHLGTPVSDGPDDSPTLSPTGALQDPAGDVAQAHAEDPVERLGVLEDLGEVDAQTDETLELEPDEREEMQCRSTGLAPALDRNTGERTDPVEKPTTVPLCAFPSDILPLWNRPKPENLPEQAPLERGFGATARGSLQLFALRELPLVARQEYRQLIWDEARQVLAEGLPRVVLIIGEAGCGKTHLVDSVVWTLQEGGWAESVELRYQHPPGQEDGYAGAARQLIRPWNETRESLEDRQRRRLARDRGELDLGVMEDSEMLARWCGLLKPNESPVAAGYGLREVYRHLDARSWRGLSVLVLDNAQWSAEEGDGLAIAEAVLQSRTTGTRRPLLVIATIRTEALAQDAELTAQIEALVAEGAVRLNLPRLDHEGTEALVRESLNLTPSLTDKLTERCEGNPLFARQLLLDWTNRGWLVDTGKLQFGLAEGVDVDAVMPRDAEALFCNRVDALAEASGMPTAFRDVLHMAALAGLTMPKALLAQLAGSDLKDFLRGCGLWEEKGPLVTFNHGLLHQAVRKEANERDDLTKLHALLAMGFLDYGVATDADVHFEVGRHSFAGELWPLAMEHLLPAAESAWKRGQAEMLGEAARLAVEACKHSLAHRDQAGRAWLWRAYFFQMRDENQEASQFFARSLEELEQRGDQAGAIEARIGLGWAARKAGDFQLAQTLLSEAMNQARQMGERRLEASSIGGLAWVEQQKRNFEGADILFTRALNRFEQLGDVRGVANAALGQAFVARRTGAFDDAQELYEEARESFSKDDDLLGVAQAQYGQAVVQRQRGVLDRAEELYQGALRIAEELGAIGLLMECRLGMAELNRIRGQEELAERMYRDHARWALRRGVFEASIFAHLGLANLALYRRDELGLYEHTQRAVEFLTMVPSHWLWAAYRLMVAAMLALRGDEDQTYQWLWSAGELGLNDTVDQDIGLVLGEICEIAFEQNWINVFRLAAKLAMVQWERLERRDEMLLLGAKLKAIEEKWQ